MGRGKGYQNWSLGEDSWLYIAFPHLSGGGRIDSPEWSMDSLGWRLHPGGNGSFKWSLKRSRFRRNQESIFRIGPSRKADVYHCVIGIVYTQETIPRFVLTQKSSSVSHRPNANCPFQPIHDQLGKQDGEEPILTEVGVRLVKTVSLFV